MRPEDAAAHGWYRFVLSYPPHLVRDFINRFGLGAGSLVLDPFCGTGTTLVEAKKLGVGSIGVDAMPMMAFASRVKTDWGRGHRGLARAADRIAADAKNALSASAGGPLSEMPADAASLIPARGVSALPLHKALALKAAIDRDARSHPPGFRGHELLALADMAPSEIGNLRFGPEVGLGRIKHDAPVVERWQRRVSGIAADLESFSSARPGGGWAGCRVVEGDARRVGGLLEPCSVDAVITSPPYPNEKDYSRTVRVESVLLGMFSDKTELRGGKKRLLRSNSRGVYKDDDDDRFVSEDPAVSGLADRIERRRVEMGKTSGFEKAYPRVVKLYFGGMVRHLRSMAPALRPGARLVYVTGDQCSYLGVMIRTGQTLAMLAEQNGYTVEGIELFRTRRAASTGEDLREEAVILRWR